MDPGKYLNMHGATPLTQHVHVEKKGPNPNSKQESPERDEQVAAKERELEDLRKKVHELELSIAHGEHRLRIRSKRR